MAKPGSVYPQVEPGGRASMERRVVSCPPARRASEALRAARRAGARTLVVGPRSAIKVEELARVAAWGLGRLKTADLGWTGLPVVNAQASEIQVRRLLMAGSPMILVRDQGRIAGVIEEDRLTPIWPALSVSSRLERSDDGVGEGRLWLLRMAGKLGEGIGAPVFAVGGFVRDLLRGASGPDLDLVVEGDGVALARRLSEESGGRLVVHPGFGTASLEGATAPDGTRVGRVDVASARSERYEAPGALPVVSPASLADDLRRRDFSVNAMALALSPSAFGRLLDPVGGQADLKSRRLRPLHPVSFVEDPTRIFRAGRYAARLGFRLDAQGARAVRIALRVGKYPALSGQRLRAELELLAEEPEAHAWRGLALLLRWGAFRLWDPGYRASAQGTRRLKDAARLLAWARRARVALDPGEVFLVALLLDQKPTVASRCLERLAVTGEPLSALRAANASAALARRLGRRGDLRPSEVAEALGSYPAAALVGAWLHGEAAARRRIQWFLSGARTARPLLSGEDIVALGVPRGPAVGEYLGALRRLRLDGVVTTLAGERDFVNVWLRRRP